MQTKRSGWTVRASTLGGLGLALSLLTGCQAWIGGMTLPSGRYLEHPPQYFPQEPDFPLTKELAAQEEINALSAPGARAPGVNGVNPVPAGAVPIVPPQN
jgi:hypothetical protein